MPERVREAFLTIRERETMEVVTVIEVLSPGNKQAGSDGRREYLRKRRDVLLSATHLVELDLLRGGERLPTIEPLPPGDYYAFVCRRQHRSRGTSIAKTASQASGHHGSTAVTAQAEKERSPRMAKYWRCSLGYLHTHCCPLTGQTAPLNATTGPADALETAATVAALLADLEENE
jgi:hypothetical protein